MPEITLRLDAPDREWADHVRALIQDALDEHGSVHFELPPEPVEGGIDAPGFAVTGIVICDEPLSDHVTAIKAKLIDYKVAEEEGTAGVTQMLIEPA